MRNVLLIKPDLIIHVGADKGSDREEYSRLGAKEVIWLEADPENVSYFVKLIQMIKQSRELCQTKRPAENLST